MHPGCAWICPNQINLLYPEKSKLGPLALVALLLCACFTLFIHYRSTQHSALLAWTSPKKWSRNTWINWTRTKKFSRLFPEYAKESESNVIRNSSDAMKVSSFVRVVAFASWLFISRQNVLQFHMPCFLILEASNMRDEKSFSCWIWWEALHTTGIARAKQNDGNVGEFMADHAAGARKQACYARCARICTKSQWNIRAWSLFSGNKRPYCLFPCSLLTH